MKTCWFPILLLTAGCWAASAQTERYVTVTAIPGSPSGSATNEVAISEAEAGEIMSISTLNAFFYFQRDGTNLVGFKAADATGQGTIIKGPARCVLVGQLGTPAYLTVKIMPESYPPDKTVIVVPGTNQVQITLESSTNLVHWSSATNGVYGRPDEARFFRIHLQKLN
jgi:hypothetical protein